MEIVLISHLVNVLVAGLVGLLLIVKSPSMVDVFGQSTPARSILSSIYLAIAITSAFAILFPGYSIMIATVLFPLQIFYKVMTVFTVGNYKNPVVISNVVISFLHAVSLLVIFNYL